jgi:hypothetical protein
MKRFSLAVLTGILLLLFSAPLHAEMDPAYEEAMIQRALSSQGLSREPAPAGKRIERIVIVNNDVVTEGDLWPQWFNTFHVTTAPDVIQRELLFKTGDRWDANIVDESSRNVRGYLYLSTAQIVAARGKTPGGVVALVVTKDIWSLRPEMSFSFVGSTLEILEAHPAEYNLAGRNKVLGADARIDLATYLLGLHYTDPRIFGSRLASDQFGDLIWNKNTGAMEGGVFHFTGGQGLYSLNTEWAWSGTVDYRRDIYRLFSEAQIATYTSPNTGESVPYEFGERSLRPSLQITHRSGLLYKNDISFGWKAHVNQFEFPTVNGPLKPQTVADFEKNVMPINEEAGILFTSYHFYRADFVQLMDIDTFGLTEDFRLGPDLTAGFGVAKPAFGYSSDFAEPSLGLGYLWMFGHDLLNVGASGQARHQLGAIPGQVWVNEIATVSAKNISAPFFGGFRLHTSVHYTRRNNDLTNSFDTLGGDSSLRGYPSSFFIGAQSYGANLEVRSRPYLWQGLHFGWVAFTDVGDAKPSIKELGFNASVGAGLRVGIPQFNKPVLRFDLATPLEQIQGASPAYFVAQFGQAF